MVTGLTDTAVGIPKSGCGTFATSCVGSFVLTCDKWLAVFCDINVEYHWVAADWAIFDIVLVKPFSYIDRHDYLLTA